VSLDIVAPTAITDGAKLYSCQVDIPSTTANNTYALTSSNEGAGDPTGAVISGVTSVPGAVVVGPPPTCCGDCCPTDSSISTSEATKAILGLVNRDPTENPAAPITTAGATTVILNLVNRVCNPCP